MVQGVDVWLNNPRRPKEASGTSGMKVIYNGGLNLSILDGWWAEGYSSDLGWAIGNGEEYSEDQWGHQDYIESQALYNLLENEVIPMFYDRGHDGVPRRWMAKVKQTMKKHAPFFNTRRMVQEYTSDYYMPAYNNVAALKDQKAAVEYANWRQHVEASWQQIKIQEVKVDKTVVEVGTELDVTATVDLGSLTPDDVYVQLYYGKLNTHGEIGEFGGKCVNMNSPKSNGGGSVYTFKTKISYDSSGDRGVSVRILPKQKFLLTPFQPGLITWA